MVLTRSRPNIASACVEAINAYRRDHGLIPMAVCSRIADYESLSAKLRLRAQSWFRLSAINRSRITWNVSADRSAHYERPCKVNRRCGSFCKARSCFGWQCSPIGILRQKFPRQSPEQQRNQLFAKFVDAMFKRRAVETRYSRDAVPKVALLAGQPDEKQKTRTSSISKTCGRNGCQAAIARPLAGAGTC